MRKQLSRSTTQARSRMPLRAALRILFAVYLVLLAWVVLWKLQTPYVGAAAGEWRPLKLVPFIAFGDFGGSNPMEVLINVALFFPFGVYLAALAPKKPWWSTVVVCAASSFAFEALQHLLSVGSFDVTDVITNTAGGFIGWASVRMASRRSGHGVGPRTSLLLCLVLTVLWVVAIVTFIALGLNFAPQRDVLVR